LMIGFTLAISKRDHFRLRFDSSQFISDSISTCSWSRKTIVARHPRLRKEVLVTIASKNQTRRFRSFSSVDYLIHLDQYRGFSVFAMELQHRAIGTRVDLLNGVIALGQGAARCAELKRNMSDQLRCSTIALRVDRHGHETNQCEHHDRCVSLLFHLFSPS